MSAAVDQVREKALQDYRKKLTEHREIDARLKDGEYGVPVLLLTSDSLWLQCGNS